MSKKEKVEEKRRRVNRSNRNERFNKIQYKYKLQLMLIADDNWIFKCFSFSANFSLYILMCNVVCGGSFRQIEIENRLKKQNNLFSMNFPIFFLLLSNFLFCIFRRRSICKQEIECLFFFCVCSVTEGKMKWYQLPLLMLCKKKTIFEHLNLNYLLNSSIKHQNISVFLIADAKR